MNVMIMSDSFMIKDSLSNLFRSIFKTSFINTVSSVSELNETDLTNLDFIFVDIKSKQINLLDKLSEIKKISNKLKIMIFDSGKNKKILLKTIELGVDGYILSISDKDEFIYIVKRILRGHKFYDVDLLPDVISYKSIDKVGNLTKRENEVVEKVAKGMNNKNIADDLYVTEYTIKKHVSSILNKLNLRSRKDIIIYYKDNGLTI
ncbi:DNA-binding response regulator [Romboutsia maritimum]|uniref:Stage 0 sporulation protein A homolog n=1 Tax=Romboutsia maritimum TaxID=2020948 RepID=A0A371IS57_9FIRM|nr:response regulator transcription factor [Romboutsia maritimum]RDY23293.1 DNA-binding response regulator [Romboutsia maritimum]